MVYKNTSVHNHINSKQKKLKSDEQAPYWAALRCWFVAVYSIVANRGSC